MLPLSWTVYSEAPSAVARMHSPAGSSGQGSSAAVQPRAYRVAETAAHIGEIERLAVIDVFRDAAREHHALDRLEIRQRLGEVELPHGFRQRPRAERIDERIRHAGGDLVELGRIDELAQAPVEAGGAGVAAACGVEAGDPAGLVGHLEAAADVQRRGRQHAAALDDRELGGAAAHVDV